MPKLSLPIPTLNLNLFDWPTNWASKSAAEDRRRDVNGCGKGLHRVRELFVDDLATADCDALAMATNTGSG